MRMNFADGMDWTQRGMHFVCVYLVVDELRIIELQVAWIGHEEVYILYCVYLVVDKLLLLCR